MRVLAVAAAPVGDDHLARLDELIGLPELVERGWDEQRRRFVPAPTDPLFGYSRCPVRGCENLTEHTATTLCVRCQHRYGRWSRERQDTDLKRFLAEVTQVRSENIERLCLVCRTPGHERPTAAHGLCFSCQRQAANRGQSVEAYVTGDERCPPPVPRESFGMCRMACDALAAGSDGSCGEHRRRWRHAARPAGPEFAAWREELGVRLTASRFVHLSLLSDRLRAEFLVGLSVVIAAHRRARISDMRRIVAIIGRTGATSILDVDLSRLRTDAVRLFVSWTQDRLRLAFSDPDVEWRKDVWDMRVFGKPQAYSVEFTPFRQPWLRELAKQWSRERAPFVHAGCTKRAAGSIAELSRSLRRRDDRGEHPGALGRADIGLFLARVARAHSSGRISGHKHSVLVADVSFFLRDACDLGLGADGHPMLGLPAAFSLSREDVRRVARKPARAAARALPEMVVAQLLDEPALGLLEQMHGHGVRKAIELLADTGRRPNEICILPIDCLDYDTQTDENGTSQKLAVLVHDMPKVARTGCRLPIDQATGELIAAQKAAVRAQYPDTPLLDGDGGQFPRARVVPYAFRHSYAQRHADNGTPVEVLSELMGHASMVTTQAYFKCASSAPARPSRHSRRCRSTGTATA